MERLQRELVNFGCESGTAIRAGVHRTSPRGVLLGETNLLLREVTNAEIDSQLNFIVSVDNWWTEAKTLWGSRQTVKLLSDGTGVTQFLTTFVKRLDPSMQDRAIAYFNEVLHTYLRIDESARPEAVNSVLRELRSSNMSTCPEQPNFSVLTLLEGDPRDRDNRTVDEHIELMKRHFDSDISTRFLTVPDDLYLISKACIGMVFWRTFIGRLLGGYSRLRIGGPTEMRSLFYIQVSEDNDAANANGTMVGRW